MQGLPLRSNLCSAIFVPNFTVIYLVAVAVPFRPFPPLRELLLLAGKAWQERLEKLYVIFISFRSSQLVPASPMAREASMGG